jgi:hypothetical protein
MGQARRIVALALLLCGLVGAAQAQTPGAGPCFWVHGRLFAANGAPTFRIWRIGTRRILGVVGRDETGEAQTILPEAVRKLIVSDAFDIEVFGDYHVCPLHKDHLGWMRFVRLDRARNLVARPRAGTAN